MNCYETLFIIKPTLTEDEIKAQVEKAISVLTKNGGSLKAIKDMGVRKLAYEIMKQKRGYYTVLYYTAPADLIKEFEYRLRYNEDILRFMTVKYVTKKEIEEFEKAVEKITKKSDSKSSNEKSDKSKGK
jgi:small subunit ribosomal protein S6